MPESRLLICVRIHVCMDHQTPFWRAILRGYGTNPKSIVHASDYFSPVRHLATPLRTPSLASKPLRSIQGDERYWVSNSRGERNDTFHDDLRIARNSFSRFPAPSFRREIQPSLLVRACRMKEPWILPLGRWRLQLLIVVAILRDQISRRGLACTFQDRIVKSSRNPWEANWPSLMNCDKKITSYGAIRTHHQKAVTDDRLLTSVFMIAFRRWLTCLPIRASGPLRTSVLLLLICCCNRRCEGYGYESPTVARAVCEQIDVIYSTHPEKVNACSVKLQTPRSI